MRMRRQQQVDWRVIIVALIVIGALEAYALALGFDGLLLTGVIAVLAGIAGWTAPQLRTK